MVDWAWYKEAERRGLLEEDEQAWFDEAKARGLVESDESVKAELPQNDKDWPQLRQDDIENTNWLSRQFKTITSIWKKSPDELRAEADAAYALSKNLDISPSYAYENMDAITKELGLRGVPTTGELVVGTGVGLTLTAFGLAPAATAFSLIAFESLDKAESATLSTLTGGKVKKLSDWLPETTSEGFVEAVDILDMLWKGKVGAKIGISGSSAIKNSNWYRRATIKERALVVKDIVEMLESGEISQAEAARKSTDIYEKMVAEQVEAAQKLKAEQEADIKDITKKKTIRLETPPPEEPMAVAPTEPAAVEIPELKTSGQAIAFGETATPEQVLELGKRRDAALERVKELQAAKDFGTEMSDTAYQGQLYREAVEAYEGRHGSQRGKEGIVKREPVTPETIEETKITMPEPKKEVKKPTKKEKELLAAGKPFEAIKEAATEKISKQAEKEIKAAEKYIAAMKKEGAMIQRGDLSAAESMIASDYEPHLFDQQVIDEEITIFERLTGAKAEKLKTTIRKETGQVKVSDIVEIDTRIGLKEQLRLEAKAAREAFRAGKYEEALKAKQKAKALLEKSRQKKELSKMHKELQAIHKKVKRGQQFSNATQKALENIYEGLDTTKLNSKKRLSLEGTKTYLEQNELNEIPPDVLKNLDRLEKKAIRDLTFDETVEIYNAVKHMIKLESLKNKLKVNGRDRDFYRTRKEVISNLRPEKEITTEIADQIKKAGEKTTRADIIKKGIKDFLTIRQLGYDTLIEFVMGFDSKGYDVFFRNVKRGIRNRLKYRQDMLDDFIADIKPDKNFVKWLAERPNVKGDPFKFTRDERMSLYRHSLNEDNKTAILEGGFGFTKNPTKKFIMTEKQLDLIIESLTDKEKDIAVRAAGNVFDKQRDAMNVVFLEQNGFDMPVPEGVYMPKDVMSNFSKAEVKEYVMTDNMTRLGIPKGRTIKRVGSKAPIYLKGLTDVVVHSINEISNYVALEGPISNASKLLYDKQFKIEVTNRYSGTTWAEIEKGLRDIVGVAPEFNSFDKMVMFLKGNMATGILGLNPFVVGIQPASFPGYGIYIEQKYINQAIAYVAAHPIKSVAEITSASPEIRERFQSGYNIDVRDVITKKQNPFSGGTTLAEKLMTPIQKADQLAVTPGTLAGVFKVQDEIKRGKLSDIVEQVLGKTTDEVLKMSKDEQTALAYEFADWVTAKTQPMFSPEHRSSISRGTGIERMMSMFGSYTSRAKDVMISTGMQYSQLRKIYKETKQKTQNETQARNRFAKALFAVLVINTAATMTRDEIRNTLYDRESKLSFMGKVIKSWSGLMFGVRDIANAVFTALDRGTTYNIDVQMSPVSQIPDDVATTAVSIVEAIGPESDEDKMLTAADELLNLYLTYWKGLPYQSAKKLVTTEEPEIIH